MSIRLPFAILAVMALTVVQAPAGDTASDSSQASSAIETPETNGDGHTVDLAAGDVDAGEALYATDCAQCHGRAGRGLGSFPRITGLEAEYVVERLIQYRAGERVGPNSGLMIANAVDLSDADIADLAAFIGDRFQ